ncbi:hypothetical protein OG474_30390 [Kribbella sp. NBC_01505]|uniref:hypothetical protein n=1 Tax=Kribbella sp. NBC_01505 TaxID=2903580 RepID=UPI003863D27A
MRVAGLDLSLTSTGIAVICDGAPEFTHTVKSTGTKHDTLAQRYERLGRLSFEIADVAIGTADIDLAVIESPSYGSKFGSPHDRSGLWWAVVRELMAEDIPVATVSPQGRAKYGSGKGNAGKAVVFAAAVETYTPLGFNIPNHDVADAVILAAMGSRHLGHPVADIDSSRAVDEKKLEAMGGAAWPT